MKTSIKKITGMLSIYVTSFFLFAFKDTKPPAQVEWEKTVDSFLVIAQWVLAGLLLLRWAVIGLKIVISSDQERRKEAYDEFKGTLVGAGIVVGAEIILTIVRNALGF